MKKNMPVGWYACYITCYTRREIYEIAEKWSVKARRINTLCLEGRIEGGVKFGNAWAILEDEAQESQNKIR